MPTLSPEIVLAACTPQQHYAWIAGVSAALDQLGITRTTDTGQIDLTSTTTVSLPPEINSDNSGAFFDSPGFPQGVFQIRKMSAPGFPDIYLRFDYGIYCNNNGSGDNLAYSYPLLGMKIGKSTDGAGNLVAFQSGSPCPSFVGGPPHGNFTLTGSSSAGSHSPSTVAQVCDFASDGKNYLTIMLGENAPPIESYSLFGAAIERSIDPNTGDYDADGLFAVTAQNNGTATWFYADITNSFQWSGNAGLPALSPPFALVSQINVVDLFTFVGSTNVPKGAPLAALSYYAVSINSPVSFPATLYTTPHTYKACARSTTSADSYNTGTKLALRFD
jgi:hypothetical protein